MEKTPIFLLLAGLLASSPVGAGSFKLDDAALAPVNDFASGSTVIAKVIAVSDRSITAKSLSTGFEKKLGGRMSPEMVGRCISVVKLNDSKFDVNPAACPPSRDTAAKEELKRKLDAAARAR
ncbi:MAG: hypothetical protein NTY41_18800 [Proteobacteria bacterium]|nr:hypothetical protein [Pseudomonadota bacterium]